MEDSYKASYLALFQAVQRALETIQVQNFGIAWDALVAGQQQSEELLLKVEEVSDQSVKVTST